MPDVWRFRSEAETAGARARRALLARPGHAQLESLTRERLARIQALAETLQSVVQATDSRLVNRLGR